MPITNVSARVVRAAAAVVLGLLAALSTASPASAHAYLVDSDPASGAVLSESPERVVLTFSEPVRLVPDRITVVSPTGEQLRAGDPDTDGEDVIIPLPSGVSGQGTYLVSYRVVSSDGHPIGGSLTYSVGSVSEPPEAPAGPAGTDPVVEAAMSIVKYLGYGGLVLVVGPAVVLSRLWPRRLSRRGVARLAWTGLGLVTVSTLAGLWTQGPYQSGGGLADGADQLDQVLASGYGAAHVVRLGVLAAAALLLRPVFAGRATRADLLLLTGLAVVGLGTWPFAGHPVASPLPPVSVVADTVHLAAAALWLGGLLVLAGFLLRLADERELGVILPEWSRWAAGAVAALVLAGLVLAVLEIGPPGALLSTPYGWLLLAKVGLVAVVLAVAGYSRRLVRRGLAAGRPRAMRVAVGIEALVLAAVVGVASVLVQTTPGRTQVEIADAPTLAGTDDFATTVETRLYTLQVVVEPAQRGSNTVHLYSSSPDGQPQPVEEWQASAELADAGVEPIDIPVLALTDTHAIGEVVLPAAGDWEFTLTLRLSDIDQASVAVTVPIG